MSPKIEKVIKFVRHHWAEIFLAVAVVLYTLVFSYFSIRRHMAFASSYDLANMDQTVWNTAYNKFFSLTSSRGYISRLGLHADLILILLSPFYLIYNHVKTLLVLQSFLIALAAVPIYLLAKDRLASKAKALLMSTVFLLNPGVQWTNLYDFHGVALAMLFLLASFYLATHRKWNWMYFWAILAMTTRETVSLAIVMLGIYIFIALKDRFRGLLTILFGGIWFLLFVFGLIPHFALSGQYWVWDWFRFSDYSEQAGNGFNLFFVAQKFVTTEALNYYLLLLKPFGFLPMLGFPWLFISIPNLIIDIISTQGQMRSIFFHYDSVAVVGLVMATILGWSWIEKAFKKYKFVGWMIGGVLLSAALRTNYHYGPLPTTPSYWRPMYEVGPDEIAFEKVLQSLPSNASITASSEVRSHVAHRARVYNLPEMTDEVDYIALVDQNRAVGDYNPKEYETGLIKRLQADTTVKEIFHQGHFYLFERDKPN